MGRLAVLIVMTLSAVTLGACHNDTFVSPPQPDLYKVPLDFAMDGGFTLTDFAMNDLSGVVPEDMSAAAPDLAHREDLADHD